MIEEFRNEPFTDFSKEENARAMRAAIEKVRSELGGEYPIVIDGERITTHDKFESVNPANRTEIVGWFQHGKVEHARAAVAAVNEPSC